LQHFTIGGFLEGTLYAARRIRGEQLLFKVRLKTGFDRQRHEEQSWGAWLVGRRQLDECGGVCAGSGWKGLASANRKSWFATTDEFMEEVWKGTDSLAFSARS